MGNRGISHAPTCCFRVVIALAADSRPRRGKPTSGVSVSPYPNCSVSSPGLARPHGLRVKRNRRQIRVSWKRVAHAARYEILVTLSDRSEVFRVTRGTHVRVPDPFPLRSGKVLVAPIGSDGSRGSASKAKIRALRLKKPKRHR